MILKQKIKIYIATIILLAIGFTACIPLEDMPTGGTQVSPTHGEIPTWTQRPEDLAAHPLATESASAIDAVTLTPSVPTPRKTPKLVTFAVAGGNLNVRRGPSLAYNYVGVMHDGDVAIAIGRDRISRWLLVEMPSNQGKPGWVTTETEYSITKGDVSSLPFLKVDSASPAYIRNCTKHKLWILPGDVQLLTKFDAPYNEERFDVGIHQVYDLEDPDGKVIQEISLIEGKLVDITKDWTGEKSKCE